MRLSLMLIVAAATAACTEPDSNVSEAQNQIETAAVESVPEDVPLKNDGAASVPAAANAQADGEADQCGAGEYQWLVGQPRSRIPDQPAEAKWRVACSSCPITMDYSPARMNIFYDEETEIVEEVKCG